MKKMDERGEALIREALDLKAEVFGRMMRLDEIEKALTPYFPDASWTETLTSCEGTAIRLLDEHVEINPDQIPKVMSMLRSQFDRYFTLSVRAYPTEEGLSALRNADSHLGVSLREFLLARRKHVFAFHDPIMAQPAPKNPLEAL